MSKNNINNRSSINTYEIDKSKLSKKPIAVVAGSPDDHLYKNEVLGFINGQIPILLKTNLPVDLWDDFCDGKLSQKELNKYV